MNQFLVVERIKKFHEKWKWYILSQNANINISHFIRVPNLPFDKVCWSHLLVYCKYTIDDIRPYMEHINTMGLAYLVSKFVKLGSIEDVVKHVDLIEWNFYALAKNKTVAVDDILKHSEFPWHWKSVSMNPNLDFKKHVDGNMNLAWDWGAISSNKSITAACVIANADKPWHQYNLLNNDAISIEDILKERESWTFWDWDILSGAMSGLEKPFDLIDEYEEAPWNWNLLSFIEDMTFENVWVHRTKDWDWTAVSMSIDLPFWFIVTNKQLHEHFNWEIISLRVKNAHNVTSHPELPWHFKALSNNKEITDFEPLLAKVEWKNRWVWSHLSLNPRITFDQVVRYSHYPWNWKGVSMNRNIRIPQIACSTFINKLHWNLVSSKARLSEVLAHPTLPWQWKYISRGIRSFESVLVNPDLPWNWGSLSTIPSLRFHHVTQHPQKPWNWRELSRNKNLFVVLPSDPDVAGYHAKVAAVDKIKRQWHETVNDCDFMVGRKRVRALFQDVEEDEVKGKRICK